MQNIIKNREKRDIKKKQTQPIKKRIKKRIRKIQKIIKIVEIEKKIKKTIWTKKK